MNRQVPVLALSIAATASLLAIGVGGLMRVADQAGTPYLGVGLAAAEALPGGAVRLVLDVANEQGTDLTADVRVAAEAVAVSSADAGGGNPPGEALWAGQLEAPSVAQGHAVLDVAGACGRRLTVTLDAGGLVRTLQVLVPCAAASP